MEGTKILHVERIQFMNGESIRDRDVCIVHGFLVVAGSDAPDSLPCWYNLRTVEGLYRVKPPQMPEARLKFIKFI